MILVKPHFFKVFRYHVFILTPFLEPLTCFKGLTAALAITCGEHKRTNIKRNQEERRRESVANICTTLVAVSNNPSLSIHQYLLCFSERIPFKDREYVSTSTPTWVYYEERAGQQVIG